MGKRKSAQQIDQKKGSEETTLIQQNESEEEIAEINKEEAKLFEFEYDPSAAGRGLRSEDEQLEKITDAIVIAFFIALVVKAGYYLYTNYYASDESSIITGET